MRLPPNLTPDAFLHPEILQSPGAMSSRPRTSRDWEMAEWIAGAFELYLLGVCCSKPLQHILRRNIVLVLRLQIVPLS